MTKEEIKNKIAKLKSNLSNPKLSEYYDDFNKGIAKLENDLAMVGETAVKDVEKVGTTAVKDVKKVQKKVAKAVTSVRKPRTTKASTSMDIEKAKAEIKAKTGKTESECEDIIEKYRALRTKSQERRKKEVSANESNTKRIVKLKKQGDIIEGTNVKTADATIESAKVDIVDKIEKQIEVAEEKAEVEATKEVAKDKTLTPAEKKKAIAEKTEEKVKQKTKTIVKPIIVDTSALLISIAETLGKFDKDSQKVLLIKLRSDIDKLLTKYSYGGMTSGATQVMNIQQSNMSSSSVNPTMFAEGGGVDNKKRFLVDFYDSSDTNRDTSIEISIRENTLEDAIEEAIKKANEFQKNYIEFYYRNMFLGSINFALSKEFRQGKGYNDFVNNRFNNGGGGDTFAKGGGVDGVVWDNDSDSIRTELGEFKIMITPQMEKGYYDVTVSANNKSERICVYGLDKAKDLGLEMIGNANKFAKGGAVEDTKEIIESIKEIRYDRLPPMEERTMSISAYQKILLEATKYAIKELYRNDYYDIENIQKATIEAGGIYNKAFVDLYGKKLTFAMGGGVGVNGYANKSVEQIWNEWKPSQKAHFLYDHYNEFPEVKGLNKLVDKTFDDLKINYVDVYHSLQNHIEDGQYAEGGRVTNNDDIITAFLTTTKEHKVNNLSTHYSTLANVMLLKNYGTIIAKRTLHNRKIVYLNSTKYSVTTTKLTNQVRYQATKLGLKIVEQPSEEFAMGGGVDSMMRSRRGM